MIPDKQVREIKILLIEDSEEDRVVFSRCIKTLNLTTSRFYYRVIVADLMEEAVKVINSNDHLDLVILDLSLPDAGGIDAINTILNLNDKLPLVILTGQKDDELAMKSIEIGAEDYLDKAELRPYTLSRAILYAIERYKMRKEMARLMDNQIKSLKMATLGEAASRIAHEINNPLTVILGYSEILRKEIEKGSVDKLKLAEYSEKIISTTHRITKIVKNLKSFARKDDLDPFEDVDIVDILNDTVLMCRERFDATGISCDFSGVKSSIVTCKDIQISQIFLNLFNNSYDAVSKLDIKWVKIWSENNDGEVDIFFSDSGKVSDKETIKAMFTPLFTTKEKGVGTGLGLSISSNILNTHGGSIKYIAESENTTFKITLPLAKK